MLQICYKFPCRKKIHYAVFHMLFELIYSCGLRISEAAALLIDNLHLKEQLIIVQGKGDKERMVPFGKQAKYWLLEWLKVRPLIVGKRHIPEVGYNVRLDL